MRHTFHSSGDLIADRRYQYGQELVRSGDLAAAIDLFQQAVERAPDWTPAWLALGRARAAHFDPAGAATAFRTCLHLDPADVLGAGLELARLDASVTLDAAPTAYIAALFDAYAPEFDTALVERLHYSAPQTLARLVRAHAPAAAPHRFARALDLGCGTGLAGEALRRDIGYLEGVDLATGMVEMARAKGVYDALTQADILAHLLRQGDRFNLVLAADVFTYIGALERIFAALSRRVAAGGMIAFTVEKGGPEDWRIGESLRFAHSEAYLRRLAAAQGFSVAALEESVIRKDRGADIVGLAVVLSVRRPQSTSPAFDSGPSPDSPSSFDGSMM